MLVSLFGPGTRTEPRASGQLAQELGIDLRPEDRDVIRSKMRIPVVVVALLLVSWITFSMVSNPQGVAQALQEMLRL